MTEAPSRLAAALADRYRIERQLGQGGMATVYLAHDLKHDRKVAVKVLRPELAAVIGAERFLSEIKTTANLQHPHILPLHDSGAADSFLYYVMPFIAGESLRERLDREKQLPVPDAIRIAIEVAGALDYAHRHGVIHRDIKPENILLHDGRALVADFGIALAASKAGDTRLTETGMSFGTPNYMSPEQAMGERVITARSDVYALGVVTYEMLSGEPPFTGPTAQSIVAKVVHDEPRPLVPKRHTIPLHVEDAVLTALEKLPADRFATAVEFATALEAPSGRRITRTRAGTIVAETHPRQLWVFGLGGLAVGLLTAFLAWLLTRQPTNGPGVSRQRIQLWDKPASERRSLATGVDISADGGSIVYRDSVDGGWQLFLKRRNQANAVAIAGTANALAPFFSPDGRWIGFTADGRLKKIPVEGGAAVSIADSADSVTSAWLDDETIVFVDLRGNLRRVSERGGPAEMLVHPSDSLSVTTMHPSPIPGGRQLIYSTCTAYCSQSDVRILDLRTRQSRELIPGGLKAWYVTGGYLLYLRAGGAMVSRFDRDGGTLNDEAISVIDNVQLVNGEPDLVVARNGTALYVEGSLKAQSDLEPVWVGRDGSVIRADSGWAFHYQAGNEGIALSPDGRRLAFAMPVAAGQSEIWIKQLDHGPVSRLTFGGINYRPEWTWDGSSVIYIGDGRVLSRRADGSAPAQTMRHASRQMSEAQMTPDGSWILRLAAPPSRDIWMTAPGDTTPRPLVADDRFEETSPRISPDGKWLVYASDESGRSEVYVRPFPNVDSGRWQVSTAGGDEPLWAHSGRELFYRDAARNLVAVAVAPGGGTAFVTPGRRVLFSSEGYLSWQFHRAYDVGPGDDRFLMIRKAAEPGEHGRRDLVLVEGWLEELKSAIDQ